MFSSIISNVICFVYQIKWTICPLLQRIISDCFVTVLRVVCDKAAVNVAERTVLSVAVVIVQIYIKAFAVPDILEMVNAFVRRNAQKRVIEQVI